MRYSRTLALIIALVASFVACWQLLRANWAVALGLLVFAGGNYWLAWTGVLRLERWAYRREYRRLTDDED